MKKTFTTLEANIDELGDEDSELTSSDSKDSSGNSHLKFHNKPTSFTGPKNFNTDPEDYVKIPGVTNPTCVVLQQEFEERNRNLLFKKSHAKSIKLDLRNVILLDNQSTMDQFCNPKLVGNIYKANKKMCLQINGGKMLITHKAQVAGYNPCVWFDQKDITNLIALNNIIKQYRVTYNSLDDMFICHREGHGNNNMDFRINESGLHYYELEDDDFVYFQHSCRHQEKLQQYTYQGC